MAPCPAKQNRNLNKVGGIFFFFFVFVLGVGGVEEFCSPSRRQMDVMPNRRSEIFCSYQPDPLELEIKCHTS